jgi:hypothetical protein
VIDSFGLFLKKNAKVAQIIYLLFSHVKSYVLIWSNCGLGNILGDFYTNSSGHPALTEEAATAGLKSMKKTLHKLCDEARTRVAR